MKTGEVILIENFSEDDSFGVSINFQTESYFLEICDLVKEFNGGYRLLLGKGEIICIFKEYEQAYLFKLSAELL